MRIAPFRAIRRCLSQFDRERDMLLFRIDVEHHVPDLPLFLRRVCQRQLHSFLLNVADSSNYDFATNEINPQKDKIDQRLIKLANLLVTIQSRFLKAVVETQVLNLLFLFALSKLSAMHVLLREDLSSMSQNYRQVLSDPCSKQQFDHFCSIGQLISGKWLYYLPLPPISFVYNKYNILSNIE